MKTIEQKALAYDEALERAKDMLSYKEVRQEDIEYLFPELKESEDERIRTAIFNHLKKMWGNCKDDICGVHVEDAIAWLEKQESVEEIVARCKNSWYNEGKIDGKFEGIADDVKYQQGWHDALEKQVKKPQGKSALEAIKEEKVDNANKVEPKFHEGEWVVWENQYYKVNYNGCGYELVDQNGLSTSLEYGTVDENAHLWDITKDAKEGDVLVSDNIVFIFNKIHDVWINCHCSLFKDDSFYGGDFDLMHIRYGKEVFPATKEQRDTLMKAMTKAGWQFDFDKKELKKIEKPTAWSQEDERMMLSIEQIMNCASLLNIVPQKIDKVRAWLKSLKERIGE